MEITICKIKSPIYEAIQYTGKNKEAIMEFCKPENIIISTNGLRLANAAGGIGEIKINPSDYIVYDTEYKELYLADEKTFNKKYEVLVKKIG